MPSYGAAVGSDANAAGGAMSSAMGSEMRFFIFWLSMFGVLLGMVIMKPQAEPLLMAIGALFIYGSGFMMMALGVL
jgi:hypothetical protein